MAPDSANDNTWYLVGLTPSEAATGVSWRMASKARPMPPLPEHGQQGHGGHHGDDSIHGVTARGMLWKPSGPPVRSSKYRISATRISTKASEAIAW